MKATRFAVNSFNYKISVTDAGSIPE